MDLRQFDARLKSLADGAYDVIYRERRYLFRKETHLGGKLIKCYGEELGATDVISLNYYPQVRAGLLKPCEMPAAKVIDFILNLQLPESSSR